MTISRSRPDARRLLAVRVGYREPTPAQTAEAVAALREISTDPELLAMQAGLALGAHNPERADWVVHKTTADFLIAAGADQERLPYWSEEGRRRAASPRPGDRPWVAKDPDLETD